MTLLISIAEYHFVIRIPIEIKEGWVGYLVKYLLVAIHIQFIIKSQQKKKCCKHYLVVAYIYATQQVLNLFDYPISKLNRLHWSFGQFHLDQFISILIQSRGFCDQVLSHLSSIKSFNMYICTYIEKNYDGRTFYSHLLFMEWKIIFLTLILLTSLSLLQFFLVILKLGNLWQVLVIC